MYSIFYKVQKVLLGIEVARSKRGIFISQRKYVSGFLKDTGMEGCKPPESPIESNHKLQSGVEESLTRRDIWGWSEDSFISLI